ncbi:MAG: efflux RND transporter periplasmic adaptor subunit [Oceanobacter sp.]
MKLPALLLVPVLMTTVLAGCQGDNAEGKQSSEQNAPIATEVSFIFVTTQEVPLTAELKGRASASMSAEVRPQVGGIIKERLFTEGREVKKGQQLYQIDPATYEAAYREAKANLTAAQSSLKSLKSQSERYAELVKIEGISQQDADDAEATYQNQLATIESYKAALTTAKINLGYTKVYAPIDGRIGISSVTPGALVASGQDTALTSINNLDTIYVDMTQSSAALLKLRKSLQRNGMKEGGAEVTLTLEDGSQYDHTGTLRAREVAVDEDTGSVTLRAEFPNPDGLLLPGMFVRATINEAVDSQGILVPQQGIIRDTTGKAYAWVIGSDNTVKQQTVETERAIKNQWLIKSGLKAGDKLVVEGTSKIQAGATVKPVEAKVNDDGSIQLGIRGQSHPASEQTSSTEQTSSAEQTNAAQGES